MLPNTSSRYALSGSNVTNSRATAWPNPAITAVLSTKITARLTGRGSAWVPNRP